MHICTPLSSLIRMSPQLGSADEQNVGWDYNMGTAGMTQSARIHVQIGRASCRERVCLYV